MSHSTTKFLAALGCAGLIAATSSTAAMSPNEQIYTLNSTGQPTYTVKVDCKIGYTLVAGNVIGFDKAGNPLHDFVMSGRNATTRNYTAQAGIGYFDANNSMVFDPAATHTSNLTVPAEMFCEGETPRYPEALNTREIATFMTNEM